jgi:large repetitive protein
MVRSAFLAGLLGLALAAGAEVPRPPGAAIPQPLIARVEPAAAAPGVRVTITGLQFAPGARVWLGKAEATDVQVETAERLTAVVPAQPPGRASVMVRNPDGRSASRGWSFTFLAP